MVNAAPLVVDTLSSWDQHFTKRPENGPTESCHIDMTSCRTDRGALRTRMQRAEEVIAGFLLRSILSSNFSSYLPYPVTHLSDLFSERHSLLLTFPLTEAQFFAPTAWRSCHINLHLPLEARPLNTY